MVATSDRRPVGFAGVRQVAGTTVVSDCFVDPDHQGQGVGTELLSRLVPHDRPVMTFASSDPKARALYRRLGMAARWDCHYLERDPGGRGPPGYGGVLATEGLVASRLCPTSLSCRPRDRLSVGLAALFGT